MFNRPNKEACDHSEEGVAAGVVLADGLARALHGPSGENSRGPRRAGRTEKTWEVHKLSLMQSLKDQH